MEGDGRWKIKRKKWRKGKGGRKDGRKGGG